MELVENYIKKYPDDQIFLDAIKAGNYEKALRIACNVGRTSLVKMLSPYKEAFGIDEKRKVKGYSAVGYAERYWVKTGSDECYRAIMNFGK